jgi:microcystin-dependent protein
MSYIVRFTEITNPSKPAIQVADQTLNTERSITFVGQNYPGYSQPVFENFLHLLENFAGPNTPRNPVQGQLWFDNSNSLLKVYDGTNWAAAGSVKKASTAPDVVNSAIGDLWVDTINSQLYLFSGSSWLLIGPQFSAGKKTGPIIQTITDTSNISHSVISFYAATSSASDTNSYIMAIISKDAFTPKALISGFPIIREGLNLTLTNAGTGSTSLSRMWGTASQADALLINNVAIPSDNFLRGDVASLTSYPLTIRSDGGLIVGSDASFNIGRSGTSTIFYSKPNSNNIDFKLTSSDQNNVVLHIDALTRVGIGTNNTTPLATLDVAGTVEIKNDSTLNIPAQLSINSNLNIDNASGASIQTLGGLTVGMQSRFSDDIILDGQLYVNYNNGSFGSAILPGTTTAPSDGKLDIGSPTAQFRNIYANNFVGTFSGLVTGTLDGNISGAAAKLSSPTTFKLLGQITSDLQSFNGQQTNGVLAMTTTLDPTAVSSQPETEAPLTSDYFLLQRDGVGLLKTTKQTIQNTMPLIPIGTIMPYAGSSCPTGYLFCDGSEVKITDYRALYAVINTTYNDGTLQGYGTFKLPDLRGRFALGRDNMNNGILVQDKITPSIPISTVGSAANRVDDISSRVLGNAGGSSSVTLDVKNLPEHQHTLSNSSGAYYALPASQAVAATDTNATKNGVQAVTTTGVTSNGVSKTGNITGTTQTGQKAVVMNPYQTINYIIFTGKLQ